MTEGLTELEKKLNGNATSNEFERSFYTRDLAPVPDILSKVLFNSMPDMVIRPTSVDEIVQVLQTAHEDQIPVTPRAGATTAYLNAVPTQKGIVVDLTSLKGIINIDLDNLQVEVYVGTSWKELNAELKKHDLTVLSVPSSGEASTVGGWFAMEGYGIGSLKYGSFHKQVIAAEVVLPHGEIINSTVDSDYPLSWFAGSEGTLGIVTKITFKVRRTPEREVHIAIEYKNIKDIQDALLIIEDLNSDDIPYNVHWSNPDFYYMLKKIGYPAHEENHVLLVSCQGEHENTQASIQIVNEIAIKTNGEIVQNKTGENEWNERFRSLRIKRGGPTLLAAEVIIPINSLGEYYKLIENFGQRAATYGHMLDDHRIVLLLMYYADETKSLEYLFLMAKTQKVYNGAIKLGGRPYGIGVWNSVYIHKAYSPKFIKEIWGRKKLIDPKNIMNPGKIYGNSKLLHPKVFQIASSSANVISKFLGIGKGR
ncbi:MAG: hypothetical protein APF76_06315 [Desulfitibacter sp. BRH_c19]|nr:MAG: hypothetical protein APF76_06315 [Desulfitibacter sp. BRH_c19]